MPKQKFTDAQKLDLLRRYRNGEHQRDLALEFGTAPMTVCLAIKRARAIEEAWREFPVEEPEPEPENEPEPATPLEEQNADGTSATPKVEILIVRRCALKMCRVRRPETSLGEYLNQARAATLTTSEDQKTVSGFAVRRDGPSWVVEEFSCNQTGTPTG